MSHPPAQEPRYGPSVGVVDAVGGQVEGGLRGEDRRASDDFPTKLDEGARPPVAGTRKRPSSEDLFDQDPDPVFLHCPTMGMCVSTIAKRVASKFTSRSTTTRNAAIVYRSPSGIAWGWWRPLAPRMHLRPMSGGYQDLDVWVWLEDQGVRSFIVENGGALPGGAIDDLHAWVTTSRTYIERLWMKHIGPLRWLRIDDYDLGLEIVVYRGTESELRVKTPLSRMIWTGADDGSDAPEGDISL